MSCLRRKDTRFSQRIHINFALGGEPTNEAIATYYSAQVQREFPTSHRGGSSGSLSRSPPGAPWCIGSTALAPPSHTGGHMASHCRQEAPGPSAHCYHLDYQGPVPLGEGRDGVLSLEN